MILPILVLCAASGAGAAEPTDSQVLGLFSDELPVAASSPIPRPVSKIAENVTVITAEDILRLNAHTLAEVLQTIPGIQLDFNHRTPGTFNFFNVQGALNSTVLVLIDGVRQNDFDQDMVNPGLIPVQQIERIEVVKGAASGSWGSALGGVINIVTKGPDPERPVTGLVSGSVGGRFTADSRGELSGTERGLGYYLTAGRLRSDGLEPNTGDSIDNLYGKLSYTLNTRGTATLGFSQVAGSAGIGEGTIPRFGVLKQDGESRRSYGFFKLQQPLAQRFSLDILGYLTGRSDAVRNWSRGDGGSVSFINGFRLRENTRGANASVTWGDSRNNVVLGGEYLHGDAILRDVNGFTPPSYDRGWDGYAAYLNGSYSIGDLSVLPGVRFDSTGLSGDQTSYSLGLTYRLTETTTLRAYGARGFSLPMLSLDTGTQRVKTLQAGVETGALPFLWLKGTYFLNYLRNAQTFGGEGTASAYDQRREGVELEARTSPWFGFALTGGYTYVYAENERTEKRLQTDGQQTAPPHVYKLALNYDNAPLGLSGALTGSGVAWNTRPGYPADNAGMIWDLSLNWKPGLDFAVAPELFFAARNLFDGAQTTNSLLCPTAKRWFEGGARFRF